MNRKVLLLLLLLGATGVFFAGRATAPLKPAPVLPPDTVIVEKVKEIPVPVEIPVEVPVEVLKPVEVVKWKTEEVPVPVETVRTVIESATLDPAALRGRVHVTAAKFEGVEDGKLKWGWKGHANCQIRPEENSDWLQVVSEPISLESSTAISSLSPPKLKPFPWRLDLRLGATSEGGVVAGGSFHRRTRWGFFINGTYTPRSSLVPNFKDDQFYGTFTEVTNWEWGAQLGVEFTIGRN